MLEARVADYGGEQIDHLCLTGRVVWGRTHAGHEGAAAPRPSRCCCAEHASHWGSRPQDLESLSSEAKAVREALARKGAAFFHQLVEQHDEFR